jgi:hypothetical protein
VNPSTSAATPRALSLAAWPLLALLALLPVRSGAQTLTNYDVDLFDPSAMAECSLFVGCAEVGAAGDLRVALAGVFATPMLVIRDGPKLGGSGLGSPSSTGDVVGIRATGHLLAAVAVLDGLELHLDAPYVLHQDEGPPPLPGLPALHSHGVEAPRFGARWTAWSQRRGAPVTVALGLDALPPVGDEMALAANTGWVVMPRLEGALWFEGAVLTTQVEALLREDEVQLGIDELGDHLSAAIAIAGRGQELRAEFGLRGTWSRQGAGLEAILGARVEAGPAEFFVLIGPGFGAAAGTPEIRGMLGVAFVDRHGEHAAN